MTTHLKKAVWLINTLSCLIGIFIMIGCAINPPPKIDIKEAGNLISEAQKSVDLARSEGAQDHAINELSRAESFLEKAHDLIRRKQNQKAADFAIKADTEAKIALAMTREAKAKSLAEEYEKELQRVMLGAKTDEAAAANIRQTIAEKLAFEAQKESEILKELASMEVQKAEVELLIAKAETEINLATQLNASRYAEEAYNNAKSALSEAKSALAREDFDRAITLASSSANHASTASSEARVKLDKENEEKIRKRDSAVAEIAKAEVLLDEAKSTKADIHASELYEKSRVTLQEAKSVFEAKGYDQARSLAEQARIAASNARAVAEAKVKETKTKESAEEEKASALDAIAKAGRALNEASEAGGQESDNETFAKAQELLEQARQAVTEKDFAKAISIARESVFNSAFIMAKVEANNQLRKKIEGIETSIIEEASKITDALAKKTQRGVVISMMGDIFAKSGNEIANEVKPRLKAIAEILKKYPQYNIIIEGHTDNSGNDKTNLKLSNDRAYSFLRYLADVEAIPLERMAYIGYGESRPIASNINEEGRRQNRRIDIVILTAPISP